MTANVRLQPRQFREPRPQYRPDSQLLDEKRAMDTDVEARKKTANKRLIYPKGFNQLRDDDYFHETDVDTHENLLIDEDHFPAEVANILDTNVTITRGPSNDYIGFKVTVSEENIYVIIRRESGWTICQQGRLVVCNTEVYTQVYKTFHDVLCVISPNYKQRFSEKLEQRLRSLEAEGDDLVAPSNSNIDSANYKQRFSEKLEQRLRLLETEGDDLVAPSSSYINSPNLSGSPFYKQSSLSNSSESSSTTD